MTTLYGNHVPIDLGILYGNKLPKDLDLIGESSIIYLEHQDHSLENILHNIPSLNRLLVERYKHLNEVIQGILHDIHNGSFTDDEKEKIFHFLVYDDILDKGGIFYDPFFTKKNNELFKKFACVSPQIFSMIFTLGGINHRNTNRISQTSQCVLHIDSPSLCKNYWRNHSSTYTRNRKAIASGTKLGLELRSVPINSLKNEFDHLEPIHFTFDKYEFTIDHVLGVFPCMISDAQQVIKSPIKIKSIFVPNRKNVISMLGTFNCRPNMRDSNVAIIESLYKMDPNQEKHAGEMMIDTKII